MISGVHAIIYSKDAERVRAFFRDVLEFRSVDAGHGWLIFALPPAELGIHPTEGDGHHELYLMCDDVHAAAENEGSRDRALSAGEGPRLRPGDRIQNSRRR